MGKVTFSQVRKIRNRTAVVVTATSNDGMIGRRSIKTNMNSNIRKIGRTEAHRLQPDNTGGEDGKHDKWLADRFFRLAGSLPMNRLTTTASRESDQHDAVP